MRAEFRKQTQRCYRTLYQWVRGILGPKFGKYGWNSPPLLRIQATALDRGLGDRGVALTTKPTMWPEINRLAK